MTKLEQEGGLGKNRRSYAFVVIILGVVIILLASVLMFRVQKIEVEGNDYTAEKTIVESVTKDPLSFNSLYLVAKYRHMEYDKPGNLRSIKVELRNPWTVLVKVKEKKIVGYLMDGEEYAYFDKNGMVVLISKKQREGVPTVEGIDMKSSKLYKKLELRDENLLDALTNVVIQVQNFDLKPDKIQYSDEGFEMLFGSITVKLGKDVTTDKMAQITPILSKLVGKAGVLHLEHYSEASTVITFKEDAVVEEVVIEEDDGESSEEYQEEYEDEYYEEDYYDEGYYDEEYNDYDNYGEDY